MIKCYDDFAANYGWDRTKLRAKSWLYMLTQIIDFKTDPQDCILAFLNEGSEVVVTNRESLIPSVSSLRNKINS